MQIYVFVMQSAYAVIVVIVPSEYKLPVVPNTHNYMRFLIY